MDPEEIAAAAAAAGGESQAAEPVSIRDSLAEAFDALTDGDDAGQQGGLAAAKPATDPKAAPAPAAAQGEPARDANGKFAKPGEAQQTRLNSQPSSSGAQAEPSQQAAAIVPPPTWSAAAKAKFTGLDPVIQQEVLRREQEMDHGRAQWQQGAERLNRLDAVLRPLQQHLQVNGVDEATFVQSLVAANGWLDTDPIAAMLELGRQKGVNWNVLLGRLQGQPAQQQQRQQLPPELAALTGQVQTLTQWASQQQQTAEQSRMQGHLDQITQFAADPANLYFENVKGRMSKLIKSGSANDLADAYSQACWADPQIRPLMLQSQEQERTTQAQAAARAKAAQAKHASGSITGSPAPGASPGGGGSKPQSVRAALGDAWDAAV